MSSYAPVLVVVDLQEGLVNPPPEEGSRSTPNLVKNVSAILSHWRQNKFPVIHVNHDDLDPEHPLHRTNFPSAFAPHACAAPVQGEPVLFKHGGSAFVQPNLRLSELLTKLGAGGGPGAERGKGGAADVFMIGMDGAQCINDNSRAANDLGFRVTVIADACATFGMPDYRGNNFPGIGAEETHVAAMSMLANGFARVVTTEEVLTRHSEEARHLES